MGYGRRERWTDRQMDGWTDTPSYRDGRMHRKIFLSSEKETTFFVKLAISDRVLNECVWPLFHFPRVSFLLLLFAFLCPWFLSTDFLDLELHSVSLKPFRRKVLKISLLNFFSKQIQAEKSLSWKLRDQIFISLSSLSSFGTWCQW